MTSEYVCPILLGNLTPPPGATTPAPSMKEFLTSAPMGVVLLASAVSIGCAGNRSANIYGASSSRGDSEGTASRYLAANGAWSISRFVVNGSGTLTPVGVPVSMAARPTLLTSAERRLLARTQQGVNNQIQGTVSS